MRFGSKESKIIYRELGNKEVEKRASYDLPFD